MHLLRSILFAPGNRSRMVEKVGQCGADAVILDLEDAVPIAEKAATRRAVRTAIGTITTCPVYVRINPLVTTTGFSQPIGAADLQAVVCPELAGILLPKVEAADEVRQADYRRAVKAHAGRVDNLVVQLKHFRFSAQDQYESPPGITDIQRLEILVEH